MTETERLLTIKLELDRLKRDYKEQVVAMHMINTLQVEWLIAQLESLKKQNRTLNKKNHRLWKVNQELTADRDELRRRYESNKQNYINVQRGRADKRRKNRG